MNSTCVAAGLAKNLAHGKIRTSSVNSFPPIETRGIRDGNMMRLFYFGALLLVAAGNATAAETFKQQLAELEAKLAAQPTNTTILFKLGDLCHDEGARDNAKAVELAEKYFKQLLAIEPTNALATALLGSALTMRARDSFWPERSKPAISLSSPTISVSSTHRSAGYPNCRTRFPSPRLRLSAFRK